MTDPQHRGASSGARFARIAFGVAAAYGFAVLVPGLFAEHLVGPGPIPHPEFYYGFYGSALVWQLLFVLVARDPVGCRWLMPVAMLEKAAFFIPCLWLYAAGRLPIDGAFVGGMIDGLLMLLFAVAWRRTPAARPA